MKIAAWLYPVLFVTGLVAGFVDAIAGGGGLITVPALLATGLPLPVAIATNRFQSSFGTAMATWSYNRAGLLKWRPLALGVALTAVGAMAGAVTLARLDASWQTGLKRVIPFLLLAIAALVWFKPDLGHREQSARWPAAVFAVVFGLGLGFYDGFFGPGTGTFWTMACVLLLGLELRAATAHTKVMNLTSNLASVAIYLSAGLVRFDLGLTMAAGQLIGGRLGSRVVVKGGAAVVRPVLLTVVLALAVKLIWDNFR